MTDFQWQPHHVEWFVETFGKKKGDLSSGDIEKRYTPKKGEPRKGKSKNGEQRITPQDFRNLMRLVVKGKFARVTQSHVRGKGYRVRMVSEDYPYVQKVFKEWAYSTVDELIFLNPMPDREMLLSAYIPDANIEWVDKIDDLWRMTFNRGLNYLMAFQACHKDGGDLDAIFDYLERAQLNIEATGGYAEAPMEDGKRELFTLEIHFRATLYRAFEIGNQELLDDAAAHAFQPHCPETHFADVFFASLRSDLIRDFLWSLECSEQPIKKLASRTYYDHALLLLAEYRAKTKAESIDAKEWHQDAIEEKLKFLMGGYKPSAEAWYRFDNEEGKRWRGILAMSDRPEVKAALAEVESAFQAREAFMILLYRRRS